MKRTLIILLLLSGCIFLVACDNQSKSNATPTPTPVPAQLFYNGQNLQGEWVVIVCTWHPEHEQYFCDKMLK